MKRRQIIPLLTVLLMALWGSPHKAAAQIFAVRANALAACTATLNLGVEVALTDRWSLEGALFWNPLRTEDLSTSFRAVQLGARYWFYETQVGPFVGAQLSHVNYLVGRRTWRYDGEDEYNYKVKNAHLLLRLFVDALQTVERGRRRGPRTLPYEGHEARPHGLGLGRRIYLPHAMLDLGPFPPGGVVCLSFLAMRKQRMILGGVLAAAMCAATGCSVAR